MKTLPTRKPSPFKESSPARTLSPARTSSPTWRAFLALLAGVVLAWLAPAGAARAEEPNAKGFWQSTDDSGKPNAWFYFTETGNVFEGRLVKAFPKPGEEGKVKTCDKCEGERKGAPLLGLPIVTGMKRDGLAYEDGEVLDPRDGTVYDARMDVSADGKKLMLRGYVGVSLLGQTKTWTRLPDNAMPLDSLPRFAGKKPQT
jgi:uncharacterized protein (DUF2147 family)